MNVLQVGGNIGSLALIPIVITLLLKLKNAEIDSLKEQNNVLKEQVEMLELFKVSGIREQFEALKKFYEEKTKEAEETRRQVAKITKELGNVKSLSKKDGELIIELFQKTFNLMDFMMEEGTAAGRGLSGKQLIWHDLYFMEGPIGELWRQQSKDGGRFYRETMEEWRKMREEPKRKEGKADSSL